MTAIKKSEESIDINPDVISTGKVTLVVIGKSPLIFNRMAAKAQRDILMPSGRKTSAEKQTNLKHDPIAEYRDSVYKRSDSENGPTRLRFPAPAFKGAMATSALDIPGAAKSKINRLVWVDGYTVNIWGVPKIFMSIVRSADMARTPDVRTRAIVPEWCAVVPVSFLDSIIKANVIATLANASGLICGVGDFRQEKGKGSFGQFELTDLNDPRIKRIMEEGGSKAQDAALEDPEPFDAETEELLGWYKAEFHRRGWDQRGRKAEESVVA